MAARAAGGVRGAGRGRARAAAEVARPAGAAPLLGRSPEELKVWMEGHGERGFRGKQVYDQILKGSQTVADMTNLPLALRGRLEAEGVTVGRSNVHSRVEARDGTVKFLLRLADHRVVETVGIPADRARKPRLTVCVSSQVGCAMRCAFCATGQGGFSRNLEPHEIMDQVLHVREHFGRRVTNVVFMGMGEPMHNMRGVVPALKFFNDDLGIGARNITVSTVGVPNTLARLAQHKLQSVLAVSLHAPTQELRQRIVPTASAYPLEAIMEDTRMYWEATGRRVSFEYVLLAHVNDEEEHAQELARLLKRHGQASSHVNLIPFNTIDDAEFERPSRNRVKSFERVLKAQGIQVSIRETRGDEASAACGQLKNANQKLPLPEIAA